MMKPIILMTAAALMFHAAGCLAVQQESSTSAGTSHSLFTIREHPSLFADTQTLQAAKLGAQEEAWAGDVVRRLTTEADRVTSDPLDVPKLEGQWSQHYTCKQCSNRLVHRPPQHVCPKCKTVYTGWPYDQVVAGAQHRRNWQAVQTLGLAYAFTGERRYADAGKQILLAYADQYSQFPYHDHQGGHTKKRGARMLSQTLDEAVMAIPLCWGYDLLLPSGVFSPGERAHINTRLFREIANTILRNDAGVSNWQSWHNAALLCIGLITGDDVLAENALRGKSGFEFQLENSVLRDGFWYEGAPAYHFYALQALKHTAEAAYGAGANYWSDARFLSMFEAPIGYTFPNGTFPAVNDSRPMSISGQSGLYALAYARTGKREFARVAAQAKRSSTMEELLWGRAELAADAAPPMQSSSNYPDVGAVMLRDPSTSVPVALHLDYGPHGGSHGHHDKLGIILYAFGKVLLPDAGNISYASPLHKPWYRATIAHNTLVVDGKNQAPSEGRLLYMSKPEDPFAAAQAVSTAAYEDVQIRRTVVLQDGWLLDIVTAESTSSHTYDLVYHVDAKLQVPAGTTPLTPALAGDGYQHLGSLRAMPQTDGSWHLVYAQGKQQVHMTGATSSQARVLLAEGIKGDPPTSSPLHILRQEGTRVTFATAVQTAPGTYRSPFLELEKERSDPQWLTVRLHAGDEEKEFRIFDPVNRDETYPKPAVFATVSPKPKP